MRGELERDTCRDVILPALAASGWAVEQIHPEFPVKATRVVSLGGIERDLDDGRVDYALEISPGLPVVVIEAKRRSRPVSVAIGQAKRYAQQLDVPLAYASNGTVIVELDLDAGTERQVDSFITPVEAWDRYCRAHGLSADQADVLKQPFNRNKRTASQDVITPRWYQSVAIHRVLRAMAMGERRLLLLMATGTGKTFTAMQLVHKLRQHARIATPDRNYRVLYLADRDALVQQPIDKDFSVAFGSEPLQRVTSRASRARELYFATYQSLAGGEDDSALFRRFPPDFFDLVIVDECHRGSASEDSSWRRILEHYEPAVQLGLTATPKRDETVDTYRYFGNPLFTYSLRDGIEDGYLAPYRVRRVSLSTDVEGWEVEAGEVDIDGQDIPEGMYGTRDFDRLLRLLFRTRLVAEYLVRRLEDGRGKMMVFCANQKHADDLRSAMANARPEWTRNDPEWVVRITGADEERVRLLEDFADTDRDSPLVATTSRLLSTGVDVEDLRYVVLFRPVGSQVEFKQIIGRGTRLFPDKGKTSFEIIDFVGATSHFADPSFDGYPGVIIDVTVDDDGVVIDETTDSGGSPEPGAEDGDVAPGPGEPDNAGEVNEPEPPFTPGDPSPPPADPTPRRVFTLDQGDAAVLAEATLVPDTSTGALVLTDLGTLVGDQVHRWAATPAEFGRRWASQDSRREIQEVLAAAGIEISELAGPGASEVDPFDLLVALAWQQPTRTRAERVRRVREAHHAEMERRSAEARVILEALLERYARGGLEDMLSSEALLMPPISERWSRLEAVAHLGGREAYRAALDEIQEWLFSDETAS